MGDGPALGGGSTSSLRGALRIARVHLEWLRPACHEVSLAGVLRRRKFPAGFNDNPLWEYVLVPRTEWFQPPVPLLPGYQRNCLDDLLQSCADSGCGVLLRSPSGGILRRYRLYREEGEIHIWATPSRCFGSVLLWRTGGTGHIDDLCHRARQRGYSWTPTDGLCTGLRRTGATERAIYAALGLPFVIPSKRQ